MAHIVKITDRNGTYQIDCNDWNGPNAPLSDTWTTLKLTGVSRCPALPKRFVSPITFFLFQTSVCSVIIRNPRALRVFYADLFHL